MKPRKERSGISGTTRIRAILWGDILWQDGIICIERAVKLHGAIGTTKSDYEKAAFLPDCTLSMLERWRGESPFRDDTHLVFFGVDEKTPMIRKKLLIVLRKRLSGFPEIMEGKAITPHCFRTTYNTIMRQTIPETLLRLQLGHRSTAMTDRYDRAKVIEKILPFQAERGRINEVWGG